MRYVKVCAAAYIKTVRCQYGRKREYINHLVFICALYDEETLTEMQLVRQDQTVFGIGLERIFYFRSYI